MPRARPQDRPSVPPMPGGSAKPRAQAPGAGARPCPARLPATARPRRRPCRNLRRSTNRSLCRNRPATRPAARAAARTAARAGNPKRGHHGSPHIPPAPPVRGAERQRPQPRPDPNRAPSPTAPSPRRRHGGAVTLPGTLPDRHRVGRAAPSPAPEKWRGRRAPCPPLRPVSCPAGRRMTARTDHGYPARPRLTGRAAADRQGPNGMRAVRRRRRPDALRIGGRPAGTSRRRAPAGRPCVQARSARRGFASRGSGSRST